MHSETLRPGRRNRAIFDPDPAQPIRFVVMIESDCVPGLYPTNDRPPSVHPWFFRIHRPNAAAPSSSNDTQRETLLDAMG